MPENKIEPLALSVADAAHTLGIGRTAFYALVKAGELKTLKLGKRTLVPVEALRSFIAAKVAEANA